MSAQCWCWRVVWWAIQAGLSIFWWLWELFWSGLVLLLFCRLGLSTVSEWSAMSGFIWLPSALLFDANLFSSVESFSNLEKVFSWSAEKYGKGVVVGGSVVSPPVFLTSRQALAGFFDNIALLYSECIVFLDLMSSLWVDRCIYLAVLVSPFCAAASLSCRSFETFFINPQFAVLI